MNSLPEKLNDLLARFDLHVSKATHFQGAKAELAIRQERLEQALEALDRETDRRKREEELNQARTIAFGGRKPPSIRSLKTSTAQAEGRVEPFDALVHESRWPGDHLSVVPPVCPQFRSKFGGLWTDLNTADEMLAGKVALASLSLPEANLVKAWLRDGYVILPGAVEPAAIDAALADFERGYEGLLDRKVSFWDEEGHHIKSARREYLRHRELKLLDLHEISEAAQAIIFAEPLSRFLHILFERPALAFQSLGFYYGSQQGIHQDSAFVRVSSPMEFVASWIALEDITPGSGELEYYPGSHAVPPYVFGEYLWVENNDPELPQFSNNLHTRAKEAGLSLKRFYPKKGDVLVWSAGLMHGGAPIEQPDRTRKSLVTHYCPADLQPMYGYKGGRMKQKSLYGNYVMAEFWEE